MSHRPIITLLTDFGTSDGYTGAVKGVIKSLNPKIDIIDITHSIESFNIKKAAFTLLNYYDRFPDDTVHLAVVDPGVGSGRNVIILKSLNHCFVGPDNGLFQYVTERTEYKIYMVNTDAMYQNQEGYTFHARDIFAPVAAKLASGADPETLGSIIENLQTTGSERIPDRSQLSELRIDVITQDKFGNIIFDFRKQDLKRQRHQQIKSIRFKNFESDQIYDYYSQVTKGTPIFLWNSQDFLELAVNQGSALEFFSSNPVDKAMIKLEDSHR